MRKARRLRTAVVALLACGLVNVTATAQEVEPRPGDTTGWHIVRPGETLEGITEDYLGIGSLWRENHRLNPSIRDPHFLSVGQRIRVILHRELPPRTAQIVTVQNEVEERPVPNPWQPAQAGDLLKEKDGVRTAAGAFAEVRFDDGVRVTLTPNSLVYLRRMDQTLRTGKRDEIEVVRGQADLAATTGANQRMSDVEIVLGSAVTRPRPDNLGRSETRTRNEDSGGSVMVYSGTGELSSGGVAVNIATGQGTIVSPEGVVEPPRDLLPFPTTVSPAAGASLPYSNPVFNWEAVEEANEYLVEICSDPDCGSILTTQRSTTTTIEPTSLPSGTWYWRVRGIGGSGLDGFASPVREIEILVDKNDVTGPAVVLVSDSVPTDKSQVRILSGESVSLTVFDDTSGIASVRYRWNSSRWNDWTGQSLSPPQIGLNALEVEAQDLRGRTSVSSFTIEVAVEPPQPPQLRN